MNNKLSAVIVGRPATKKNSGRIVKFGNRMALLPSKAFEVYQDIALWQLKKYKERFDGNVHVQCKYYLPNNAHWPDLVGLLQATSDILEKSGILENDRLIVSYDGSRIMGIDKENPRAEIFIEKWGE